MIRILALLIGLLSCPALHAEGAIWENNKITPAQPFPGKVLGVESSWGGYRLIIESLEGGERKYCIAQVWPGGSPHLSYQVVTKPELPPLSGPAIFLNPAVEVNHFSWSMGARKIGKVFGEKDCLLKAMELDRKTKN